MACALPKVCGMVAESSSKATGGFWDFIGQVGDDTQFLGIGLVIASVLGWAMAASLYYGGGYHRVVLRLPPSATTSDDDKGHKEVMAICSDDITTHTTSAMA